MAKKVVKNAKSNTSTRRRYWIRPFLTSLTQIANVTVACESAKIERKTAYVYRSQNAEFSRAWDEAIEIGIERLEQEAWRRAHDGYDRPIYQGGVLVGTERQYSDTLMTVLLKAHAPYKYRERTSVEHVGVPLQVQVYLPDNARDSEPTE